MQRARSPPPLMGPPSLTRDQLRYSQRWCESECYLGQNVHALSYLRSVNERASTPRADVCVRWIWISGSGHEWWILSGLI